MITFIPVIDLQSHIDLSLLKHKHEESEYGILMEKYQCPISIRDYYDDVVCKIICIWTLMN